jgi:putative FmdB family regulatory protein
MPIYEFRCENCSKTQEHIVKLSEADTFEPSKDCCDKPEPKRFIGKVNIKKGASWGPGKGNWLIPLILLGESAWSYLATAV